jgi:hypothetical protein
MKLMTKEILNKIPALYADENTPCDEKICYVKFFNPVGSYTWYATEFDPATGIFFGWVDGDFPEWGNFSLEEMQNVRLPFGLGIERDKFFTPKKMKEIQDYKNRGI